MSKALAVSHGEYGRAALYDLDRPITTHAHREGHLIFYVSGTAADVRIGASRVLCDDAVAAAVSPWEPHSFDVARGGSCLCLVLYVRPMWFLESTASADYALKFGCRGLRLTPDLVPLVRRLAVMMLDDSTDLCLVGLLFDLVRRAYDLSWRGKTRPSLSTDAARFSDYRVRRSQRLMKDFVFENRGMDALASEVGLSRPHFFKLFKKQTGVTPNVYFNTLRSEQAIDDLLSTGKSVTDIAYDLGFASQASFTRFFSLNVGISPSDYRRVASAH